MTYVYSGGFFIYLLVFLFVLCLYLLYAYIHTLTVTKRREKTTQEWFEQYWTGPGGNTPQSSSYTATYHPSQNLSKLDEPDMQETAGVVGTSS